MNEAISRISRIKKRQDGIAFSLTGLGGSNAFGAGFLQAALDWNVEPRIVTCTSGMIYWTWRYLEASRAPAVSRRGRLRREIEEAMGRAEPFPKAVDFLNNLWLMTAGVPGIFRWAREEYLARFLTTPLFSLGAQFSDALLDLFFPAQLLVPTRPRSVFVEMAKAFKGSKIGVCFNSLLAETATEYLHVNDAARAMLDEEHRRMKRAKVEKESPDGEDKIRWRSLPRTVEAEIDAQAIEDALWLTLYGAHSNVDRGGFANRLDGAYLRSTILSELTMVETVLMPRPIAAQRAAFPSNYFENQDFQTELWWNASYAPQVAAIEFVNRLVEENKLPPEDEYGRVNLVPVEIDVDRGFFLYFREDLETFDRGYNEACATFARLGLPAQETDSPVYTFIPGLGPPQPPQVTVASAGAGITDPEFHRAVNKMEAACDRLTEFTKQAEKAAGEGRHLAAAECFKSALEIIPSDAYLRQQFALHTYKSKQPSEQAALNEGLKILALLDPEKSVDPETLGITGAIYRCLFALTGNREDLDKAISFYGRGFEVRRDYYNGENLATCLDLRAEIQQDPDEKLYDRISAKKTRQALRTILYELVQSGDAGGRSDRKRVYATAANVAYALGEVQAGKEYENSFRGEAPAGWEIETFEGDKKRALSIAAKSSRKS